MDINALFLQSQDYNREYKSQVICKESWRRVKSQNTGTPEDRRKYVAKSNRIWSCPLDLIWFLYVRLEHVNGIGQIKSAIIINVGVMDTSGNSEGTFSPGGSHANQTPWSCQYGGRTSRWHSSLSFNSSPPWAQWLGACRAARILFYLHKPCWARFTLGATASCKRSSRFKSSKHDCVAVTLQCKCLWKWSS